LHPLPQLFITAIIWDCATNTDELPPTQSQPAPLAIM
jgi:hypothetical protein